MKFLRQTILGLGVAAALLLGSHAEAQNPVTPKTYGLTNSTTFTSGTNLATASLTLINSQPFPIWRGRGFAYTLEFAGTNAGTAAITPFFQVATPVNGQTNWSQYIPGTAAAMSGTTRIYAYGLVPPTTIDNATIGRLAVVSNAHSASVTLSATNTYVSVIP